MYHQYNKLTFYHIELNKVVAMLIEDFNMKLFATPSDLQVYKPQFNQIYNASIHDELHEYQNTSQNIARVP